MSGNSIYANFQNEMATYPHLSTMHTAENCARGRLSRQYQHFPSDLTSALTSCTQVRASVDLWCSTAIS